MTLDNIAINGNPVTQSQIAWPNLSPNYYPIGGILPSAGPQSYDPNGGRPPRQYQYSAGIQREIARDLVVDASYVGNQGIWWYTTALTNLNYLSTPLLSQYGLSLSNPANLATLIAPIGSAAAGVFQNRIPFTGFPLTATVAQSLRPFPQFNSGLNVLSAPLGNTQYDALQLQVNKRFSHGFQFTYSFVWSKNMDNFGSNGTPDVQNRALAWKLDSNDQPLASKISWSYSTPRWGSNKFVSQAVRDWTISGFLQYASGVVLGIPTANTVGYPSNLNTATMGALTFQPGANPQNIVAGQPLYLDNLNCHCFNPSTVFALNPAAWANPAPGQFGNTSPQSYFRGRAPPRREYGSGAPVPDQGAGHHEPAGGIRQRIQPHVSEQPEPDQSADGASLRAGERLQRHLLHGRVTDGFRFRNHQHIHHAVSTAGRPIDRPVPVLRRFQF